MIAEADAAPQTIVEIANDASKHQEFRNTCTTLGLRRNVTAGGWSTPTRRTMRACGAGIAHHFGDSIDVGTGLNSGPPRHRDRRECHASRGELRAALTVRR